MIRMFVFKKQCKKWCYTQPWSMRGAILYPLDRGFLRLREWGAAGHYVISKEDVPVGMGIVIDNSGSMRDKRAKSPAVRI